MPSDAVAAPRPALTVNQASSGVLVRLHDGSLVGSVSDAFAQELLGSQAATRVGRDRVRYLRLEPDIRIQKASTGWSLIEKQRHFHGDKKVSNGANRFDHRHLRWEAPTKRELEKTERE